MISAYDRLITALRDKGTTLQPQRGGTLARCPAHEDQRPSLSISKTEGKVLLHCFAGCDRMDVLEALGWTEQQLFDDWGEPYEEVNHTKRTPTLPTPTRNQPTHTDTYQYVDENSNPIFEVRRYQPKTFRPYHYEGDRLIAGLNGTRRVLYHLDKVVSALQSGATELHITEGEADADHLTATHPDTVVTCCSNGSKSWNKADPVSRDLAASYAIVHVYGDDDPAGESFVTEVIDDLTTRGCQDVRGWITRGTGDRAGTGFDLRDAINKYGSRYGTCLEPWPRPTNPWEHPIPLQEGCPEPFPVDVLPPLMAAAVNEIADELKIDPAIPATAFLGAYAGLIGAHTKLTITHGWTRRCNLYIGAIADTGDSKTPACTPAWEPVRTYDQHIRDQADSDRRHAKLIIPRIKTELTKREKTGTPPTADDLQLQTELEERERTLTRTAQAIVDDVTPERLADIMHDNGGVITALNDEGSLIRHLLGLYSDTANLDPWLKGWDQNPLTIDRKGSGQRGSTAIRITEPTLTVAALIQPTTIREMGTPKHRHLIDRGVLARMCIAWPISRVGTRFMAGRQPRPRTATPAWNQHVTDHTAQPADIALTPDAHQRLMEWRDDLERQLPVGKLYADVRPFAAKAPDQAARLAGLFARADQSPTVNPDHIDRGTRLTDYYLRHAITITEAWHGTPYDTARRILGKILNQEGGLTAEGFTVRDVGRAVRGTGPNLVPALEILEAHHYIRPTDPDIGFGDPGRTVGKRSPAITVNPKLHTPKPWDSGDSEGQRRDTEGQRRDTDEQQGTPKTPKPWDSGDTEGQRRDTEGQRRTDHPETALSPAVPAVPPPKQQPVKRGDLLKHRPDHWDSADTVDSGVTAQTPPPLTAEQAKNRISNLITRISSRTTP